MGSFVFLSVCRRSSFSSEAFKKKLTGKKNIKICQRVCNNINKLSVYSSLEMRVGGVMNDYSQQRVLVTVLFISEIKRRTRVRVNVLLPAERSRKQQHL